MKKKLFLLFFVSCIGLSGCIDTLDKQLIGLWSVDVNEEIIYENNWEHILGNTFDLESNYSCRMMAFYDPCNKKRCNTVGTWNSYSMDGADSLIINVKDHPLNGRYKIDFYRDYEKKALKMKLTNSDIEITCGKFFQDFDAVKKWE